MGKSLNHKGKLSHNGSAKNSVEERARHWKHGKSSGKGNKDVNS